MGLLRFLHVDVSFLMILTQAILLDFTSAFPTTTTPPTITQKPQEAEKEEVEVSSEKCFLQCGGMEKYTEVLTAGELQCSYDRENGKIGVQTSCFLECLGFQADEDQNLCMCEMCKNYAGAFYSFCEGPESVHIKHEDCDDMVCTGKAKYYGAMCELANPEHFENTNGTWLNDQLLILNENLDNVQAILIFK